MFILFDNICRNDYRVWEDSLSGNMMHVACWVPTVVMK